MNHLMELVYMMGPQIKKYHLHHIHMIGWKPHFYTSIKGKPYCSIIEDKVCQQSYKDKGFNFKIRLKEEGVFPAIAIGINDIAGTGLYSSEYIIGSYGINRLDFHFGLGWGALNGSSNKIKNPMVYISDSFYHREYEEVGINKANKGGQFEPGRYFSGKTASPLLGLSYSINKNILFKIEYDSILAPGSIGYEIAKRNFSYGLNLNLVKNIDIGIFSERGNYTSIKFTYKNNPKVSMPSYEYKKAQFKDTDNKYAKLIKSIEANGIGVNKIIETPKAIGVELTQFIHPNLDVVEEIIKSASYDSGINKPIKKDLRVASLQSVSEYNKEFEKNSLLIYQRKSERSFNTKTNFTFRPYLASREDFLKGALLLENNSEFIIKDNFFFSTNIKYSIWDNFEDLSIPPVNTYPAQVRSDIKDYLRGFKDGVFIGRAQFDYHLTPKKIII